MANGWTTIRISDPNHERLKLQGSYGETMDQIIGRLLDEQDKKRRPKA